MKHKNTSIKVLQSFFLAGLILFIGAVSAIQLINLGGQPSDLSITFLGNENHTYNITVFIDANFTSALLNFSSYSLDNSVTDVDYGDYNFTSMTYTLGSEEGELFFDRCIFGGCNYWLIVSAKSNANGWSAPSNIYPNCSGASYSKTSFNNWVKGQFMCVNDSISVLRVIRFEKNASNAFQALNFSWGNFSQSNLTNPSFFINNTKIWNYTGVFNQTNNKSSNFKNTLNTALNEGQCNCAGCSLAGENCSINFIFHSDSSGILEISDMNVNWLEYTAPNFTLVSPNETFTGITYIPLNFTASDNWALETCYYNVTRGASLEIANTKINCYSNTTFTVSGDAFYILNMCINDSSGNQNCSSKSFRTIDYVPPTVSPGGGGGGSQLINILEGVKAKICEPTEQPFSAAWTNFKEKATWPNFVQLWYSFWNLSLCKSGASILGIE